MCIYRYSRTSMYRAVDPVLIICPRLTSQITAATLLGRRALVPMEFQTPGEACSRAASALGVTRARLPLTSTLATRNKIISASVILLEANLRTLIFIRVRILFIFDPFCSSPQPRALCDCGDRKNTFEVIAFLTTRTHSSTKYEVNHGQRRDHIR